MGSRGGMGGTDRNVRQTIPSVRRKARSSPRSSSVSAEMRSEAQDLIEAEREYERQQELEKCASDLAMEAMEYKFLSRRKRLMARKLMRESKDKADEELDSDRQPMPSPLIDSNGNVVNVLGQQQQRPSHRSVAPDLALSITTRMDFCEPQLLLEKPGAQRELTPEHSIRAIHDREMKKYDDSEPNGKKRSRFTASLIRTHTSDSDQEPEEDSGYEAKSGITDTTQMDPSRAVSRGSLSSSLRPFSSDFESAWGSQELLESDSSVRKKSSKSRSSDDDREHDMFQDAEECLESIRQYGDFEAGGIERPLEYEVIDLPPTRIDVKDKSSDKNDKNNYNKESTKSSLLKTRKPRTEGRRSTSDPVRDRMTSQNIPLTSVVRRGSTAMPYHFSMPSTPPVGYMKPTVASLRARYERDDIEGMAARDRYKISEEDSYRLTKVEEEMKNKKLDEEKNKRYEEWLKKLDEVNVIPQSAKERVKKLEEELKRLKKATEESELHMARAYRRRLLDSDESEMIFPMSRKTQTKPELQYQVKMISRFTQTDDISSTDVSVNTEIDFRLMSALLEKLLIAKTSVAVQTDWKNDVVETRDVGISTDRIFRELFRPVVNTRSMSAQTEVSALIYKDESVATDLEITGHRHRNRSLREPSVQRLSSGVQTDQKWISRKDVGCEANLSSFSSESEESVVSAYPKGFDPKTGQLIDESLLSHYYKTIDQNVSKFGARGRDQGMPRVSKTPEPIIEEYPSSSTSSSTESNSEGDYSCENVREIYREKYSEYKSASKPMQKSFYHMKSEEKKINLDFNDKKRHSKADKKILETDLQDYDREPQRPELRHKFTADRRPEPRPEVHLKSSQIPVSLTTAPTKPLPIMKSTETQTNGEVMTIVEQSVPKPVMKVTPKDLKTESKITVEVTKANKKERSEVTSLTKLDEAGKMSRTTQVTTSKHIPVQHLPPMHGSMHEINRGLKAPPMSSPQRSISPMRKAQSEMDVTPVSGVSTRPASADDLSMTQSSPKIPTTMSYGSSAQSLRSSMKSPSPTFKHYNSDEITVPKVGRVSIQDPLHLVLAPPESFDTKSGKLTANTLNGLLMPIDKSRWKETSSSTICNEMTTDAFKDEEGNIQKPKTISMSTETLIERKGNESSVKTRSRTARKYSNETEEKAITNETSFAGTGDIMKDNFPYIESKPIPRVYSPPHRTSSSPVVTLVDTPDILSPEPEQMPKTIRTKMSSPKTVPSLASDVRSSRYGTDEDDGKRLVQNTSRRAAVVEPVQQYKSAVKSDVGQSHVPQSTGTSPATEIITRIIRTSELDESKKFRKSKTVFEQELQSGRDGNGGGGCHISSSIAFDNPSAPNSGVIIKELNEDGTSKDGSTDNLDQKSGEIMTETNFQRFKSPERGINGCEETSWKYTMECNCINGSNTTVRTTIDYKKIKYPLTSYETSL